ncbi:hypothetical protein MKW92_024051 [Papaver armeniacum]|nr:hypothetical protein MKW92_024051 [Papaver armeniacum]
MMVEENTMYVHYFAHVIHHEPTSHNHIIIPSSTTPHQLPSNGAIISPTTIDDHITYTKKPVKYRESLMRSFSESLSPSSLATSYNENPPEIPIRELSSICMCKCCTIYSKPITEVTFGYLATTNYGRSVAPLWLEPSFNSYFPDNVTKFPCIFPREKASTTPHHHHHPLVLLYNMSSLPLESLMNKMVLVVVIMES